ncbi:hypothetical protein LY625_11265 [Lysobacter sp. GX 14042]|uniref:hypothetical protein n=1 Tax=Lysobacter sp. GX 14042 TaxID=2907155 RepID=UPI001F35E6A3|nr:hypothetical protein [Lysobacter sp. GX 14042]MCE7033187.1 hypothetical protein [Lysobacter sp. GX 14042]
MSADGGGAQPAVAWWYDLELDPVDGEVRGIPVGEFDPGWAAASGLGEEELALHVAPAGLAALRDAGLYFVTSQDLDLDGVVEDVFVGTYEAQDGGRGRFLAISRGGRLLRHFVQSGSAGFSALLPVQGGVRWYKCLECGEYELLRWTGGSYVLE